MTNSSLPKNININEIRRNNNTMILTALHTRVTTLSKEFVRNNYTGRGGLHGLNRKNYTSYHAFSSAKKCIEQGQFFTPQNICSFIADMIQPEKFSTIIDPTSGHGSFANIAPQESNFTGVEIDQDAVRVARFLYPKATFYNNDLQLFNTNNTYDYVFGNPPFNLQWEYKHKTILSQFLFLMKSYRFLKTGGLLAIIVPSSFLDDDFMSQKYRSYLNDHFNFILQYKLPENAFESTGVKNFSTKILVLQKKSKYLVDKPFSNSYVKGSADWIYNTYIKKIKDDKKIFSAQIKIENNNIISDDALFFYKLDKYIFDIQQNSKSKKYLEDINYLIEEYNNQEKPSSIKESEWDEIRVHKSDILRLCKKALRYQNVKKTKGTRIVKTQYGIKRKNYTFTGKDTNYTPFYKYVTNKRLKPPKEFAKLIAKKRRLYDLQNTAPEDLTITEAVKTFLDDFTLTDSDKSTGIKLRKLQKSDIAVTLTRPYNLLAWEMGGGKTIASLAWSKYYESNVETMFVVGPALAINGMWSKKLQSFGHDFMVLKSLNDMQKIRNYKYVILSFNALIKLQKHIKKYINSVSRNIGIIIDECDEMCNPASATTKAIFNVFLRAKKKLLLTGTSTRNTGSELYVHFAFLYNYSYNFMDKARNYYRENKRKQKIVKKSNPNFNTPFDPKHGFNRFKASFSPKKTTVFGAQKDGQTLYNIRCLTNLIRKTIISRTFEELAGKNKYKIITHNLKQYQEEKELYNKIMKDFVSMWKKYYTPTNNVRKDSMLKIIHQISCLIKACSVPQHFKEYSGLLPGRKFDYIVDLVRKNKDQKVLIGVTNRDTLDFYYEDIKRIFRDRKVYKISGSLSFKKRNDIIEQFENENNSIIICTQQSLKSAVNIPSCNCVIVESLQWNIAKMSQFYFRCIRLDSQETTKVHFVIYKESIEQNIMKLVLAKEKINDFVRTLKIKKDSDIFKKFDIDSNIIQSIIKKVKTDDGVSLRVA